MAQSSTTIPTKLTTQELSAVEFNELNNTVNANAADVTAFRATLGDAAYLATSTGGNSISDAGKVAIFDSTGKITTYNNIGFIILGQPTAKYSITNNSSDVPAPATNYSFQLPIGLGTRQLIDSEGNGVSAGPFREAIEAEPKITSEYTDSDASITFLPFT